MASDEQFVEKSRPSAYVGIIPAAGVGSRLPGRKLSKEVLPVGGACGTKKPVIACLLNSLSSAGVRDVTVIIREGKQDIAEYLAGGEWHQLQFNNRITAGTSGVPETVAIGLRGITNHRIAFGFPDILFEPGDAVTSMMRELDSSDADVVLGLFPTSSPDKMDMVDTNRGGQVTNIQIKPGNTRLDLTWILAVWEPHFSSYLLELAEGQSSGANRKPDIVHLGHVFQRAIADGLKIGSVSFRSGRSLDIGTPDDLLRARNWPG